MLKKTKKTKKKSFKDIQKARVYAKFSFNNTLLSVTRENGELLKQTSCGSVGFKNTKKSTPYAAQRCAESILKTICEEFNISEIELFTNGLGAGRDVVLKRFLGEKKIRVSALIDKTPVAYGGCRPRKAPRK